MTRKRKTRKKRIGRLSKAENSGERKVKRILLKLLKKLILVNGRNKPN
jgi:hypothetical protein